MSDYSHNAAMGPEHQQSDLHLVLPLRLEPLQKYTHDFRNISHGEYSTSVYFVLVSCSSSTFGTPFKNMLMTFKTFLMVSTLPLYILYVSKQIDFWSSFLLASNCLRSSHRIAFLKHYSWPNLVVPYTEELISLPFVGKN